MTPGTLNLLWTTKGQCHGEMRIDGALTLTDDEKDVASLSPGGLFTVEAGTGTDKVRRVEIYADTKGTLTRTWIVDGSRLPYDDEARAWLASILPTVQEARKEVDKVERQLREQLDEP